MDLVSQKWRIQEIRRCQWQWSLWPKWVGYLSWISCCVIPRGSCRVKFYHCWNPDKYAFISLNIYEMAFRLNFFHENIFLNHYHLLARFLGSNSQQMLKVVTKIYCVDNQSIQIFQHIQKWTLNPEIHYLKYFTMMVNGMTSYACYNKKQGSNFRWAWSRISLF